MGTDKAVNEAVDIAVGGDAVGGDAVGGHAVGGHAVGDDAVGGGRIGRGRWSGTTDTVSPPVSPARVQNLELLLLVGAAAVTTAALVSVEIDQQRALTGALGYLGAAYLGLFAVVHLAVRRWARTRIR